MDGALTIFFRFRLTLHSVFSSKCSSNAIKIIENFKVCLICVHVNFFYFVIYVPITVLGQCKLRTKLKNSAVAIMASRHFRHRVEPVPTTLPGALRVYVSKHRIVMLKRKQRYFFIVSHSAQVQNKKMSRRIKHKNCQFLQAFPDVLTISKCTRKPFFKRIPFRRF